jgi:hypothetical protein
MKMNDIPLNDIGGTGIFGLMAAELSATVPPPRAPAREAATATPEPGPVARLVAQTQERDRVVVDRPLYTRYAPGLRRDEWRAISASGVWSTLGFVGASVFGTGLFLVTQGGTGVGGALAFVLAGGALAAFAWRRAWAALARIDGSSTPPAEPPAPLPADIATLAAGHPRVALIAH